MPDVKDICPDREVIVQEFCTPPPSISLAGFRAMPSATSLQRCALRAKAAETLTQRPASRGVPAGDLHAPALMCWL